MIAVALGTDVMPLAGIPEAPHRIIHRPLLSSLAVLQLGWKWGGTTKAGSSRAGETQCAATLQKFQRNFQLCYWHAVWVLSQSFLPYVSFTMRKELSPGRSNLWR